MKRDVFGVVLASVLAAGACAAAPAYDGDGPATPAAVQKIMNEKAPPLVTVKYVLKGDDSGMGMFGDGGDREMEVTGVMIEGSGLVLVSNTEMGGMMARFARMMPGMGGGAPPKPTDIKVLVGEDTQGVEASLIARDSELDLAWVRVKKAPEKPYAFLDLTSSAAPKVGDYLYSVGRMGKFFDRAPVIHEFRLVGIAKKPRDLYIGGGAGMGLPVYNAAGDVIGVTSLILPSDEEMEGAEEGMFGGMGDTAGGMIVPAAEVVKATKSAVENAAKGGEEEKKDVGAGEDPMKDK
ncbi:hypothetical protein PHYC_03854 [Phycisphaerales bacterium]|nr:hypothetical protein PHYC_03854 [Phycisphaerales bacterium]